MLRFARLLTQWIGIAATVVVAFELTVRFDDWSQFDVPMLARPIVLDELAVRDSLGLHARPGTHFRQFRINSLGFRGPEVTADLDSSLLIIASGASETFGLYESPDSEWPRQLEDSLRTCAPQAVVLNAAFAGMSLPTVEQDFQLRLQRFRPKYVLYYPTPMQYLSDLPLYASEPSFDPPEALSPFRMRAGPRLRDALKRALPDPVLSAIRGVLLSRDRASRGVEPKSTVELFRIEAFESDLRRLVGTYRAGGATPVLVVHRNRFAETVSSESRVWLRAWERFYPGYTGPAIVKFDSLAAERVRRVGKDSAVLVVDPLQNLRRVGQAAFSDFSHFTTEGSAAVSGAVAEGLRSQICRETSPRWPDSAPQTIR